MANFVNVFFLGALVAQKDKTIATPRHKLKWLCERWTSLVVSSFRILSEGNFRSECDPFDVTCLLCVLSSELVFMTGYCYCSFGFGQFSFWSYVIVWFLTRLTNEAEVIWNAAAGGAISVATTTATSVNYSSLHLAYVAISYCIAQLFRVILALLLEIILRLASVGSVHAAFCFTGGPSAFGLALTWTSERNVVSINQDV